MKRFLKEKMKYSSFFMGALVILIISNAAFSASSPLFQQKKKEYVFLLHGLGRTSYSMRKLEKNLHGQGYTVINFKYDSTDNTIEDIVKQLEEEIKKKCVKRKRKIHFVTHSLGGILVRYYLKDRKDERIGRVVMIAPPNQGSELADWLKEHTFNLYEWVTGAAGQQLGTDEESIPLQMGDVDFELGIIAGDKSLNPFYSSKIPGPDDGKVSVESTKIEGMKDFLLLHESHSFIMNDKEVIRQVIFFLENGKFNKDKS